MESPITGMMIDAAAESMAQLRARVANVRWDHRGLVDGIAFEFDGVTHHADLRGRNRDAMIGYGAEQDASIAICSIIDGDAQVSA